MPKPVLLIALTLVLIASLFTLSVKLNSELNIELTELGDFGQDDIAVEELRVDAKQMILHLNQRPEMASPGISGITSRTISYPLNRIDLGILLPPPEYCS